MGRGGDGEMSFSPLPLERLLPNAQCPLALSEAVRVASRREGMPNAQLKNTSTFYYNY